MSKSATRPLGRYIDALKELEILKKEFSQEELQSLFKEVEGDEIEIPEYERKKITGPVEF